MDLLCVVHVRFLSANVVLSAFIPSFKIKLIIAYTRNYILAQKQIPMHCSSEKIQEQICHNIQSNLYQQILFCVIVKE